jgi:hypothetical protein
VPQLVPVPARHPAGGVQEAGHGDYKDAKDINRLKFLARLSAEIGKRGVIDVLRKGVDHGPLHFDLFYGTPSPGNAKAEALHAGTVSRSRASLPTAWTRRAGRSTCACSSTACPSPPSS